MRGIQDRRLSAASWNQQPPGNHKLNVTIRTHVGGVPEGVVRRFVESGILVNASLFLLEFGVDDVVVFTATGCCAGGLRFWYSAFRTSLLV